MKIKSKESALKLIEILKCKKQKEKEEEERPNKSRRKRRQGHKQHSKRTNTYSLLSTACLFFTSNFNIINLFLIYQSKVAREQKCLSCYLSTQTT